MQFRKRLNKSGLEQHNTSKKITSSPINNDNIIKVVINIGCLFLTLKKYQTKTQFSTLKRNGKGMNTINNSSISKQYNIRHYAEKHQ